LPSPGECAGAVLLENLSAMELTFLVEMIVDGTMKGYEFLPTSHGPELSKEDIATARAMPGEVKLHR
jgi:hypothetical protein